MNRPIDPIPSREHLRSVEAAIQYQQALVHEQSDDDEFLAVAERVLLGLMATAEMMRSQNLLILARSVGGVHH